MHSSRDQIASAMRKLDSATIRGKIATGELTQGAAEIAEELLVQRDREGSEEPIIDDRPSQDDPILNATADFFREPFGWSWIKWTAAVFICIPIVASFGTHARQENDQTFLYFVILAQSLILAGILRTIGGIFTSALSLGILGKALAIGILLYALGALSVCSILAQSGWGGG